MLKAETKTMLVDLRLRYGDESEFAEHEHRQWQEIEERWWIRFENAGN